MSSSVQSFLKCLAVMSLSLAAKDVGEFRTRFTNWASASEELLRKHSMLRDVKAEFKLFLPNMEMFDDDAEAFAAMMKPYMPDLMDDLSITREEIQYIKDALLFFRKGSEPAWKRLSTNVARLKEPSLSAMFLDGEEASEDSADPQHGDMTQAKAMAAVVLKLTGRKDDPILTLNEVRDFRESNPKEITKYSDARKIFSANYKKALLRYVRSAGKELVNAQTAAKFLAGMGCNYIPKGFVGQIDEQGRLHTTEGRLIKGMLVGEVVMNPNYDAKKDNTYVCSLKANRSQRLRTEAFVVSNKSATFRKVSDFADNIDKYRKMWVADLSSLDEKTSTIAAMVETIHEVLARIGGDSTNKDDEERFGMSTVQMKHIKIKADGIHFKYPGKKGTVQTHWLRNNTTVNKKVVRIIKELAEGKGPEDLLFTYRGKPINGQAVNAYLRSKGLHVTIHKFRHVAGTKMANEILARAPFKKAEHPSQASVDKWIKEEFKEIGTALHHRSGSGDAQKVVSSTAIAAYVDPQVLRSYYTGLGLRTPTWVPKA